MNIIFLDIDGVLNSINYFIDNHSKVLELYQSKDWNDYNSLIIKRAMMDIDKNKLRILKEIIDETGSYVVVISSWKIRSIFPNIRDELINMGIPIIGVTVDYHSNRGKVLKNI